MAAERGATWRRICWIMRPASLSQSEPWEEYYTGEERPKNLILGYYLEALIIGEARRTREI